MQFSHKFTQSMNVVFRPYFIVVAFVDHYYEYSQFHYKIYKPNNFFAISCVSTLLPLFSYIQINDIFTTIYGPNVFAKVQIVTMYEVFF